MNLCDEVTRVCEKYYGLLVWRDLTPHPCFAEYEASLRARLDERKTALAFTHPTLLFFNRRFLFANSQLRLYCPAVDPIGDLIVLALFGVKSRQTPPLHFTHLHLITPQQWQAAPLSNEHYKAFNLTETLVIPLLEQEQQEVIALPPSHSLSDSLSSSIEMCVEEGPPPFDLFWIHEQLSLERQEQQATDLLERYIQFILDVYLWQRFLHKEHKVKQKTIPYYARLIGSQHASLALLFIHQMIQLSADAMTSNAMLTRKEAQPGEVFYDSIAAYMMHEWIAAELFLFHHFHWHRERDTLHVKLLDHIVFVQAKLPRVLWPNWFDYNLQADLYWQETAEHTFKIKSEWLFKQEFESILQSQPLIKGYIYLSEASFASLFLPTLYKCLLGDALRFLYFVHHSSSLSFVKERRFLDTLTRTHFHYEKARLVELYEILQRYRLNNPLTAFNCASVLGDVFTPVVRKMVKKRAEFELSNNKQQQDGGLPLPWYEQEIQRETLPDLEDLGRSNVLPPCLAQVFAKEHLGNTDRMNITRYLLELGYSKQETVEFLCKGADREYTGAVSSTYVFYDEKRRKQPSGRRYDSFGCSSVINTVPQEKNSFRCPFEARQNGELRRKDHSMEEKRRFMCECRASLTNPDASYNDYITHPVQYILLQLQK